MTFIPLLGRALLLFHLLLHLHLILLLRGGCCLNIFVMFQPPPPGALRAADLVDTVRRVALASLHGLHGRTFWIVHLPIGNSVVHVHRVAEGATPSLLLLGIDYLQVGEGRHFSFPLGYSLWDCTSYWYLHVHMRYIISFVRYWLYPVLAPACSYEIHWAVHPWLIPAPPSPGEPGDSHSLIGLYRCHPAGGCASAVRSLRELTLRQCL